MNIRDLELGVIETNIYKSFKISDSLRKIIIGLSKKYAWIFDVHTSEYRRNEIKSKVKEDLEEVLKDLDKLEKYMYVLDKESKYKYVYLIEGRMNYSSLMFQRIYKTFLKTSFDKIKKIRKEVEWLISKVYETNYNTSRVNGKIKRILWDLRRNAYILSDSVVYVNNKYYMDYFVEEALKDKRYYISLDKVKKGDVILSYKTDEYFSKGKFMSNIIHLVQRSNITHSLIAYSSKDGVLKWIVADGHVNKTGLAKAYRIEGEYLLVFEPRIERDYKKIYMNKIDEFVERIKKDNKGFSFRKFSFALIYGILFYSVGFLFTHLFSYPNLVDKKDYYYCSQIVGSVFRDSGLFITPRNDYPDIMGPVEFLESPYLKFKGVLDIPVGFQ